MAVDPSDFRTTNLDSASSGSTSLAVERDVTGFFFSFFPLLEKASRRDSPRNEMMRREK
jgi:hypothetical protein